MCVFVRHFGPQFVFELQEKRMLEKNQMAIDASNPKEGFFAALKSEHRSIKFTYECTPTKYNNK